MITATKTRKPQKQVQVIARYTLKRNGHVIYAVRSSNRVDQYQVLVIDGAVQSCSCPAHGHCYHKRGVQIIEENRREAAEQQVEKPAVVTEERYRVSRVDGIVTKWYPEYCQGAEWFRFPQPDGGQAVSFFDEAPTRAWLADRLAAVAEQAAERKMDAFKRGMDEQYSSDPRRGLSQGEMEAAQSYLRHYDDRY